MKTQQNSQTPLFCPSCARKIERAAALPEHPEAVSETENAVQAEAELAPGAAAPAQPDAAACRAAQAQPDDSDDETKKNIRRIVLSGLLLAAGAALKQAGFAAPALVLLLGSAAVAGWDVCFGAVRKLLHREMFDENLLMTIAAIGAFCIGCWEEGAAVLFLFRIGETLQDYAADRSRRSVSSLLSLRPDFVNLKTAGGYRRADPRAVKPGDSIVVLPGERVPLDCTILEGKTFADTAALTGEPVPRSAGPGEALLAGYINGEGKVTARVEKAFGNSTVDRIIELVEKAGANKAKAENFITKFARLYTPLVTGAALLLAVLPPLVFHQPASGWIYRALVFLVVSCPCALVISVPMGFFAGIGAASANGVLVKGGNYLEALSKLSGVIFDKTGTLTHGVFEVTGSKLAEGAALSDAELLRLAASAEADSRHPIALSLQRAAKARKLEPVPISDEWELAGQGVVAVLNGRKVAVGNTKLMRHVGADPAAMPKQDGAATCVYVAVDSVCQGCLLISDRVRDDAAATVRGLKAFGIRHFAMLTGDSAAPAKAAAESIGIDTVRAGLMPGDKLRAFQELSQKVSGTVAFVGDGINDAPVLAGADIGIAMGGAGSDAAVEAADVVVMNDEPIRVLTAVKVARVVRRVVVENITFALGIKFLVLVLGALGLANIWAALFADTGVMVLAVLNSARVLIGRKGFAPPAAQTV